MPRESYNLKPAERAMLTLRNLYRAYGYLHYKVSKFEEYDLYMRNKSFLADENVLTFTDTDGRLLALKPDITLSIIKNAKDADAGPRKVYYNENVYRTAGGGFKEIMQTGLECIGHIDAYAVCEVVLLAYESLACLGGNFLLDLSHMGFVSGLLEEMQAGEETAAQLLHAVGEKNAAAIREICAGAGIDAGLAEALCTIALLYGPAQQVLQSMEPLCRNAKMRAAFEELRQLCSALETGGREENLRLDFSVINDMNYYDGIIFQGFLESIPHSVLSGGRYDRLAEKMGKQKGAIGFAVYLDGLERAAAEEAYDVDVLLEYTAATPPDAVLREVKALIAQGLSVKAQCGGDTSLHYRQNICLDGEGKRVCGKTSI